MNAGRELDALVAEKVMGWVFNLPPPSNKYYCLEAKAKYGDASHPVWVKTHDGYQCGLCNSIPDYSTSIAEAWGVVEKLKSMGLAVWVGYEAGEWVCMCGEEIDFVLLPEISPDSQGWAETAPLAICLTALKAVGYNTEVS